MKMMNMKNLAMTLMLISTFSLTGCKTHPEEKVQHFDDTLRTVYEPEKGVLAVNGDNGIYMLVGKYKRFGISLRAGQVCNSSGIHEFLISDLLAQYPGFKSTLVEKEAEKQKKRLKIKSE